MALLRQREKNRPDRRRSLAGIPVFHEGVRLVESPAGIVTLQATLRRGGGFFERFRPPVHERKYELDEFGTFVVRRIQERKCVLDIIRAFEKRFGMTHRESELGVVAFIKMLMKRNVLSVVVK